MSQKSLIVVPTRFEAGKYSPKDGFGDLNSDFDILISGIGVVNTLFSLTKLLAHNHYSMIYHLGISGSFVADLPLLTIVNVEVDQFGDFTARQDSTITTHFQTQLMNPDAFPLTKGKLLNNTRGMSIFSQFPTATGVTVSALSTNPTDTAIKKQLFEADIETMEGAAVAYVCLNNKTPFVQLRVVSNMVGEPDRKNWKLSESTSEVHQLIAMITGL